METWHRKYGQGSRKIVHILKTIIFVKSKVTCNVSTSHSKSTYCVVICEMHFGLGPFADKNSLNSKNFNSVSWFSVKLSYVHTFYLSEKDIVILLT